MCGCSPSPIELVAPLVRLSLHQESREEAERFKWIESEKAGRDLGESALLHWVREHWNGFLRERWLEHLQGRAFWIELEEEDFGLLEHAFPDSGIYDEILWRFGHGEENLDIILWAIEEDLPMEEVMEILETLHINSRRLACKLECRLSGGH